MQSSQCDCLRRVGVCVFHPWPVPECTMGARAAATHVQLHTYSQLGGNLSVSNGCLRTCVLPAGRPHHPVLPPPDLPLPASHGAAIPYLYRGISLPPFLPPFLFKEILQQLTVTHRLVVASARDGQAGPMHFYVHSDLVFRQSGPGSPYRTIKASDRSWGAEFVVILF